ncbi:MAG: 4-hydroxy-3-methylbut-2-enyl diphosphate reductase [Vicinamibacterales bacterium]
MNILRASHLGMCFGVRDAIDLAVRQADAAPLTVLGDLVHNETVLADLRARGITIAMDPSEVRTQAVMITAHGASERRLAATRARGLDVVEATCPLVHVAHKAIAALRRDGYHPVIIGQRDHVEVRGLTEDLDAFDVVLDEADVDALAYRPRLGVASQTTQPLERVRRLTERIRRRFPQSDVRLIDTVCLPTKQRQQAAVDLAAASDVVIVVGGANSNNTRELVQTCGHRCARVHHVQAASDLRADWFEDAGTVGITAGTSTPDAVVDAVEARVRQLAAIAQHATPAVASGR